MKITAITDEMRKLMRPEDRAKLGKAGRTGEEAQAAFVAKSEKDLQSNIANLLRQRGIWFDMKAMHRKSTATAGCPDFIFVHRSLFWSWEVKFGKGKLEPDQERARDLILKNGGQWALITSVEEARQHLDAHHV